MKHRAGHHRRVPRLSPTRRQALADAAVLFALDAALCQARRALELIDEVASRDNRFCVDLLDLPGVRRQVPRAMRVIRESDREERRLDRRRPRRASRR